MTSCSLSHKNVRPVSAKIKDSDDLGMGQRAFTNDFGQLFFHNNLRTVSAKIKDFDDLGMGQAYFYKRLRVVFFITM